MHQNIVLLQILFDVAVGFVQIGVYILIFVVEDIDPFVFFYPICHHFVLHLEEVEFDLIDYT